MNPIQVLIRYQSHSIFSFLACSANLGKNIRKPKLEKSLLLITINFEFKKFLNESFDFDDVGVDFDHFFGGK